MKELNPELKRWVTPPDASTYLLRIPKGSKEAFDAAFASVPEEQKITWERHLVAKGESLAGIARQYNTTPEAIRDSNGMKNNRITPGKHLLVPIAASGGTESLSSLAPEQFGKKQQILYRVRRGDNLTRIAKEHDVTVADIRDWNNGLRTIRAGQKIKLVVDVDKI
jgi:membrane-bound lytic murein transglycosylase D